MEYADPNREEIFKDNLYNTYYPGRPKDIEDVCFPNFVANYDWYSKDSKGNRKYFKLTKPWLVNHIFYPKIKDHRENYYYSLILLFVPFRDEVSLLNKNDTAKMYSTVFCLLVSVDCSAYYSRMQTMLQAEANVKAINEARQVDGTEKSVAENVDDRELPGEAKSAMKIMCDMNANSNGDLTLEERINMFNADQRNIFDNVKSHLMHQKQHEEGIC